MKIEELHQDLEDQVLAIEKTSKSRTREQTRDAALLQNLITLIAFFDNVNW